MHVLLLALLASPLADVVPSLDGNWKLSYAPTQGLEFVECLIRLEASDGRLTGRVLGSAPRRGATALEQVARAGDQLLLVFSGPSGELRFQGRVPAGGGPVLLGSYGSERFLNLARLTRTEQTELTKTDLAFTRRPVPEPLRELASLNSRVNLFRFQAGAAKDAPTREEAQRRLAEAEEITRAATPLLCEAVVTWHADNPAVFEAGLTLLRKAALPRASPARVAAWARAVVGAAEPFGRCWLQEQTLQVAEALAAQPGYGAAAVEYARRAEEHLTDQDTDTLKARTLTALTAAHERAGQPAEARQAQARLARIEGILDAKYRKEFPPLQVPRVEGGGKSGGRAVVLEFFTGTQCGSCNAPYLALDALLKSYELDEFVLLQYHISQAGPDPMVNPDAEARRAYYAGAYPTGFPPTPAVVLDGKPDAPSGHASHGKKGDLLKEARRKYNLYAEAIDQRREVAPPIRVAARVERQGDRLAIRVEVRGLPDPGAGKRLRVVLAEDAVRHMGGNGLRFHHCVVRAMPGGPAGLALRAADGEYAFDVSLAEVRETLSRHLDELASRRSGPGLDLPPELRDLRVVAFVQNDATREILQGCQVRVSEASNKR